MVLMEYWPNESAGKLSATLMTMQIEMNLFGEGTVSSPFRRKSGPDELVRWLCGRRVPQLLQAG